MTKRNKQISVAFTQQELNAVQKMANRDGLSKAALIRQLLAQHSRKLNNGSH